MSWYLLIRSLLPIQDIRRDLMADIVFQMDVLAALGCGKARLIAFRNSDLCNEHLGNPN